MASASSTRPCICQRHNRAHEPSNNRLLVPVAEIFGERLVGPDPEPVTPAQLYDAHVLAEDLILSAITTLTELVFDAASEPRSNTWVKLIEDVYSDIADFERTVLVTELEPRLSQLYLQPSIPGSSPDPEHACVDAYILTVQILFTVARLLLQVLPFEMDTAAREEYLAYVAETTGCRATGVPVPEPRTGVVSEKLFEYRYEEAEKNGQAALAVCRWAVCALDRVAEGAMAYARGLTDRLRIASEAKIGERSESEAEDLEAI